MISKLLQKNKDPKDMKVLEYTGGSLGVSLALITNLLNLKLTLVLSESTAPSVTRRIKELGAKLHFVEKEKGFLGVINTAINISKEDPSWSFLYQHINKENLMCHFNTTGLEILNQAPVKIDSWVASIGTGGTLMGVYNRLVETFPDIELYATNPDELAYGDSAAPNSKKKFSGSGGLGYGKKQQFVMENESKVKKHFRVSYEQCLSNMMDFYQREGLKIGSSAAANLYAAREIAKNKGKGHCTVTIFPALATSEEWNDVEKHTSTNLALSY